MPTAWPLLGHLPAFCRDKPRFLDRCAETGQAVIRLDIGGPTLLLREPADIRYVLQEAAASFAKSPLISSEAGQQMFGQGEYAGYRIPVGKSLPSGHALGVTECRSDIPK